MHGLFAFFFISHDLLLQVLKKRTVEKFAQRDLQPIAKLLNGNRTGIPAFLVQHTVNGGRGNARSVGERVDGHISFIAKLEYSFDVF